MCVCVCVCVCNHETGRDIYVYNFVKIGLSNISLGVVISS